MFRGIESSKTYENCLALYHYAIKKQLSDEVFKGWTQTLTNIILVANNNSRQSAFRKILSIVNGSAGIEDGIIYPK